MTSGRMASVRLVPVLMWGANQRGIYQTWQALWRDLRRSQGMGVVTTGRIVFYFQFLPCSNPYVDRCSNPLPCDPLSSPQTRTCYPNLANICNPQAQECVGKRPLYCCGRDVVLHAQPQVPTSTWTHNFASTTSGPLDPSQGPRVCACAGPA